MSGRTRRPINLEQDRTNILELIGRHAAKPYGIYGVTIGSVVGILALSLLELFVAVLQAYIFTFLTALFMGMALHPEH